MRIWVAYKFRGASFEKLRSDLEQLEVQLSLHGHEMVTMIKSIQAWDAGAVTKSKAVKEAYELMKTCDVGLFLYPTNDPSEGRGWDAGYMTGLGKPTIMATHKNVSSPYTEALYTTNIHPSGLVRYDSIEGLADTFNQLFA